ncbi:MAG: hypothetical protein MUE67_06570 [Anaerolineales bacterium]|nr:hypothetical protein [Anaerolineales bacterium]
MKTRFTESFSRFGVLAAFAIALYALILAPVSALRFSRRPFPGFMLEQTLVISGTSGVGWTGQELGLVFPQRVIALDGQPVPDAAAYEQFLQSRQVGQTIQVRTESPQGEVWDVFGVRLIQFPGRDFLRLFWLPYSIGLVYIALGVWIYWLRGSTGAGRAFAYFCASASIVNSLMFDIWTTHVGTPFWTFALAQLGGAMIGLAVLFPREGLKPILRAWVRGLAYGISALLALWGLQTIFGQAEPWAYITPWQYAYVYGAVGIGVFIASLILRLRRSNGLLERQQARIILWGSSLAFAPVGVWLGVQAFWELSFNPLIFSPLLVIFPLFIAFAMVRYRLWDFDLVLRRTLIDTTLTVILVVLYLLVVMGLDQTFERYLGQSNLFNVIATLLVVVLFTPLRRLVQRLVDRQFYRRQQVNQERIQEFSLKLRTEVDLEQLKADLIGVIEQTLQPEKVDLWLSKAYRSPQLKSGKEVKNV